MKIKKAYLLIVLFLCGLSVGNLCASASAAAAAEESAADCLRQELGDAAWRGDKAKIEELIAGGADVNARDENGNTILIMAAQLGKTGAVELLLSVGADVNDAYCRGQTALIHASRKGRADIVDLLLKKEGIEVNATDMFGDAALMYAAMWGYADIVLKLLNAGADKDIRNNRGQTAEYMAQNDKIAKMIRDFVLPSGRRTKRAIIGD